MGTPNAAVTGPVIWCMSSAFICTSERLRAARHRDSALRAPQAAQLRHRKPRSRLGGTTMASADFSRRPCGLTGRRRVRLRETSLGKNRLFRVASAPFTARTSLVGLRASAYLGALPILAASYGVSVRQTYRLPRASFRSSVAAGTLASGCVLGAKTRTGDFHPLEPAHARRTSSGLFTRSRSGG